MARIAVFIESECSADEVPADLEDALRARLDEVYVGEFNDPWTDMRVLGIDVDDD